MRKLQNYEKEALWIAFDRKCWICERHVAFSEMEIEHLLPQSLHKKPKKLEAILEEYGLPKNFELSGLANLRPSHSKCNRIKSDFVIPRQAFEIINGWRRAKFAEREANRLNKQSNIDRAIKIIETEIRSCPLEPAAIEALSKIIDKAYTFIQDSIIPLPEIFNPMIPNPENKNELLEAVANIEPFIKRGQSYQLGMYLGAILGLGSKSLYSGLSGRTPAKYYACFKGLNSPGISETGDSVFVFVQTPSYNYQLKGSELMIAAAPLDMVFVSLYRKDIVTDKFSLINFNWTSSTDGLLPEGHERRYIQRIW